MVRPIYNVPWPISHVLHVVNLLGQDQEEIKLFLHSHHVHYTQFLVYYIVQYSGYAVQM